MRVLVLGVKQPWFEADHLSAASAEWIYTSTVPDTLMACTATTFPLLLIQPQSTQLRGLIMFFPIV
jgi:hypothetical protein